MTKTIGFTDEVSENTVVGRILKGVGGLYTVKTDAGVFPMNAKGIFRKEKLSPLPGDIVDCTLPATGDTNGVIVRIHERKNSLIRPACANVDRLFIVACAENPKADIYTLDKQSAIATKSGIEVFFIFNKCDICEPNELAEIYRKSGFKVFCVSANSEKSGEYENQFSEIKSIMKSGVSFFSGASGVGKSSIIGHLFPDFSPETGVLSKKTARGKHTTRATELFVLDNDCCIADTPGFSMLEAVSMKLIEKDELLAAFPDIEKHSHNCRYRDCSHTKEGKEDCSVALALSRGEIAATRHESFCKLKEELDSVNPWDN